MPGLRKVDGWRAPPRRDALRLTDGAGLKRRAGGGALRLWLAAKQGILPCDHRAGPARHASECSWCRYRAAAGSLKLTIPRRSEVE